MLHLKRIVKYSVETEKVEKRFFPPAQRVFVSAVRYPLPSLAELYPAAVQKPPEVAGNGDEGKSCSRKLEQCYGPGSKHCCPVSHRPPPRLGERRGPASLPPPLLPSLPPSVPPPLLPPQGSLTFGERCDGFRPPPPPYPHGSTSPCGIPCCQPKNSTPQKQIATLDIISHVLRKSISSYISF